MTVKELKDALNKFDDDMVVRVENLTEFGYHSGYQNSDKVKILVSPHESTPDENDGKNFLVLRQI